MNEFLELMKRLQSRQSLRQIAKGSGLQASTIRYAMRAKKGPRLDTVLALRDYEARLLAQETESA